MHHGIVLIRRGFLFVLGLALLPLAAAAQEPVAVGEETLRVAPPADEAGALEIALVVFDPGIPADKSIHDDLGIFTPIRESEASYLPVLLRETLVASGSWGAVRVYPQANDLAELAIEGTIVHSDGLRLALSIRAEDATGRLWFERIYEDYSKEGDYPVAADGDPYLDLYRRVANDLASHRDGLTSAQLREIREVALLRYAQSLAPDAFASYLGTGPDGRTSIQRLPARDDPMLARVDRIRNQEYIFIDTIDEQYLDLRADMAETYNLWRQYGREQAVYREEYEQRLEERDSAGRRGSFASMQQVYNAYRWSKIQEQDLDELALGFDNEVAPTSMEVAGRVFRLSGTLDSQYQDWRAILREIFALETGLPVVDDAP